MTRFYFHVRNGNGFTRDEEGRELLDSAQARKQALQDVRSILSEEVRRGLIDLRGSVEITDAAGNAVVAVPFSDAVELRLEGVAAIDGDDPKERA